MNRSLAVLVVLAVLPAHADFRFSDTQLQLYMPGAPWALTMPRGNCRLVQEQRKPDDSGLYYFAAGDKGLELSVYLDRTSECSSPSSCMPSSEVLGAAHLAISWSPRKSFRHRDAERIAVFRLTHRGFMIKLPLASAARG